MYTPPTHRHLYTTHPPIYICINANPDPSSCLHAGLSPPTFCPPLIPATHQSMPSCVLHFKKAVTPMPNLAAAAAGRQLLGLRSKPGVGVYG